MLFTSVLVRPWRSLAVRSSFGRATLSVPSSARSIVIGATTVWLRVPFGPFTVTSLPSIVTSTPLGTGMGSRPIRDMGFSSLPLPDVGEDFPAHALLSGLPIGEQAGRRGDDRHAKTAEPPRQVRRLRVDAQ